MASEAHLKYRRMDFSPNVPDSLFTEREIELLKTYGSWLAALMKGVISPESPAQRRFIEVCDGTKQPESEFEKVWVHYIRRKLWESENPEYVGRENGVLSDLGITGRFA